MFESFWVSIPVGLACVWLILWSAEWIVKKLIGLGHHFGVSNAFIGLTVLSIGTSLPEIGSHVAASIGILSGTLDYQIASATVLGANIGSDVIQQTLIVGLVVFIAGGMTFSRDFLKKSYSVMIGTTLLTLILGWDRQISRLDGMILLGAMALYLWYLWKQEHLHPHHEKHELKYSVHAEIGLVVAGMFLLLGASTLVLHIMESIVQQTGLGGSFLGVITLGVASALPEFVTAIQGLRQKAQGISLGTLIGSNITNPLVAIGLGGVISTYYVPGPLVLWDLPMETVTAALLLFWLFMRKGKLGRAGAVYLILLYVAYIIVRATVFAVDF